MRRVIHSSVPGATRRVPGARATLWLLLGASGLPAGLQAQSGSAGGRHAVVGTVRSGDDARLVGARVELLAAPTPARQTLTSAAGEFRFGDVPAGQVLIRVRRLGFRAETLALEVPQLPGGGVVIPLERVAQPLRAVVVRDDGRGAARTPFERRRSSGFGRFITRADIEQKRPQRTTELLRTVPGLSLERSGDGGMMVPRFRNASVGLGSARRVCEPTFWVDGSPTGGAPLDLDALSPDAIEGIELYSGAATTPAALRGSAAAAGCGVIAIWTRQGMLRPPGTTAGPEDLAGEVAAARAYTADQVDEQASPLPGFGITPAYPDSLRGSRLAGAVVVEFVVDVDGTVEPESAGIVSATHPLFADAVRASLASARFSPARRRGSTVRQVVHWPVRFLPLDDGASAGARTGG